MFSSPLGFVLPTLGITALSSKMERFKFTKQLEEGGRVTLTFEPLNGKSASEFSTTVSLILSQIHDTGTLHPSIILPRRHRYLSRSLGSAFNEFVNVEAISGMLRLNIFFVNYTRPTRYTCTIIIVREISK